METQSFGICFLIRKCKADKKRADIYARITVDGEEKEFSTKEQIDACNWNREKATVRGNSITVRSINDHLENIRFSIKEKYRKLYDAGELITAEIVRKAYVNAHAQLKGHKLKELLAYYKKIWEPKLKNGGFKNYKSTIRYIEAFLKFSYPSGDVYLSQINNQFATDFEHYIRTVPLKDYDPCKGNGIGKHIQRFKRILNWAEEIQWVKNNPVEKYSCPIKKNKRKKLNLQQLFALEEKIFQDVSLNYVRDLFINSCYTGFAFVDAMELREQHFEWEDEHTAWCKIYRAKSDVLSPVPLLNTAVRIVNKYKNHPESIKRGTIFPYLTNQHVNRCLKLIQQICEFDVPLTFHVARHTFAKTVALKNGIPLETVQMLLGHTKITTTQIYAEVDEEKIIDDMSGLDAKLETKRQLIANLEISSKPSMDELVS